MSFHRGLFLGAALLAASTGVSQAALLTLSSGAGAAIPDGGPANGTSGGTISSTITVANGNNFVINPGNSVTVTLTNWSHSFVGDLIVTLTGPGGAITRTVFDRPGVTSAGQDGCGGNMVAANSYVFNSGNATTFGATCGTNLAGGSFSTTLANDTTNSNLSSAWNGTNINNTAWTLNVTDNNNQDSQGAGWLWSITFNETSATPEPATVATALMGLGLCGLGALRRRKNGKA